MPTSSLEVRIVKEPESPGFYSYSPDLPGCFSCGLTVEETKANMLEAIHCHISSLRLAGIEIPYPEKLIFSDAEHTE